MTNTNERELADARRAVAVAMVDAAWQALVREGLSGREAYDKLVAVARAVAPEPAPRG